MSDIEFFILLTVATRDFFASVASLTERDSFTSSNHGNTAFLTKTLFVEVLYPVVLSKNQVPISLFIITAYCPAAVNNAAIPAVRLSYPLFIASPYISLVLVSAMYPNDKALDN